MTSVAAWLAAREPAPPPALLRRLEETLGADARRDARDAAEVCLAAGERLLITVLRDEEANRGYALDLLAADALVTYAFEAASGNPRELSERATRAMSSIAALGISSSRDASTTRA